jgi:hypothetical protein
LIARPWRQDLTLGAAAAAQGGLAVVMTAERPWQGRLEFDFPRHQHYLGFQRDWPRMNTLPEWYTVDLDRSYRIQSEGTPVQTRSGAELRDGLEIQVDAGRPLNLRVEANET